jgi:hypothetical protein
MDDVCVDCCFNVLSRFPEVGPLTSKSFVDFVEHAMIE